MRYAAKRCGRNDVFQKGKKMKTDRGNTPVIVYVSAFLIGVILFWSFGKNWLDFESKLVFTAGVVGVAVSVIIFGVWNMIRHSKNHSDKKDN